jgi:hypothetical protein
MARPLSCPSRWAISGSRSGIEAKAVVLQQLRSALAIIQEHQPARITTVGGECSVSMAPFSYLINKHGDDLVILWIDSHPDTGTGACSARTRYGPPARHCSTGSATPAPRRWPSTLTSTRSTRTRSSWVWEPIAGDRYNARLGKSQILLSR